MPKRHQQNNKSHSTNRVGTSISVGPEAPNEIQEQTGASQPLFGDGFVPSYEDIQRQAYQIHEEKGGSDLENWLEAEKVLRENRRKSSK